jgi:hypothetical protein
MKDERRELVLHSKLNFASPFLTVRLFCTLDTSDKNSKKFVCFFYKFAGFRFLGNV